MRALLVAVGLAVLGVTGYLLTRPDPLPPRVTAPPVASLAPAASSPEDLARASCVQVRLAAQGVSAGSDASQVRGQLAAARALAAQAVREDGRWAALSGGVAALDEAVRRDEGDAAAMGLRTALEQCAELSR